jgi:hypothetical protein
MSDQPVIRTVAEVIASRRGCYRLLYAGCPVLKLDWHPSRDGRHYAEILDGDIAREVWLKPETYVVEHPILLGIGEIKNGDIAPAQSK